MVQGQKYRSFTSPGFVRESSRHKRTEIRKALPSHDVVMFYIKGLICLEAFLCRQLSCRLLLQSNAVSHWLGANLMLVGHQQAQCWLKNRYDIYTVK